MHTQKPMLSIISLIISFVIFLYKNFIEFSASMAMCIGIPIWNFASRIAYVASLDILYIKEINWLFNDCIPLIN